MSSVGPKQHVFTSLAVIAQALGHAHRLELLEHLGQGERSVEDLAARAGLTLANTSRHLQLLRRGALVEGRREGETRLLPPRRRGGRRRPPVVSQPRRRA